MRRPLFAFAVVSILASAPLLADNWPHWRGPTHNGFSAETGLPVKWGAECVRRHAPSPDAAAMPSIEMPDGAFQQGRGRGRGQNPDPPAPPACAEYKTDGVSWHLPLPAYSGSTPIVWNDVVFLSMATANGSGDLELWAIDRNKKGVMWKRPIAGGNHIERKQNMSSPSPVTDGTRVWVMTGVGMLKAFDFKGTELWSRDIQAEYGRFGLNWGYASSPLLQGDALYIQVLHGMKTDDPSYVFKVDKASGKTLWKVERPTAAQRESPDSYTTPLWLEYNGKTEVVVSGGDAVTGHDPATGKELWRIDGLNPQNRGDYRIVASPTVMGGLIVSPSRNNPLTAIKPGGSGLINSTHIAWQFASGPDVPSPVSDGKYIYVVVDSGVVYCLEVATGKVVYGPERLPNDFYSASPVLADGKVYVTGESNGITTVFRAGPTFEVLSSNSLADSCTPYCLSTVAVSQGQLFVRLSENLWVIGDRKVTK